MLPANASQVEPVPLDLGLRPLVVRRLIRAMFTQKLVAGDRLVVNKLAMQLGASSTPVREALLELNTLGLVDLIPNRGAVCLAFGAEQLREMYLVRRVLEVEATRRAAVTLASEGPLSEKLVETRSQLEELLKGEDSAPAWLEKAVAVDVTLHDLIAAHCGSPRLRHEIDRYKELMVCVRETVDERSIQRIAVEEHVAIIEHLLGGRADQAADAMRCHLEHTAELVANLLFPAGAEAPVR